MNTSSIRVFSNPQRGGNNQDPHSEILAQKGRGGGHLIGLGLTVIMTGSMPLIAQAMASVMGRERLTINRLLGAVVVLAILLIFL